MKTGDRVTVQLTGVCCGIEGPEPSVLVLVDDLTLHEASTSRNDQIVSTANDLRYWINTEHVFPVPDWTDKPDQAWRQICADMILHGEHDREAVALLVEHSPKVVQYIQALEALHETIRAMPSLGSFAEMIRGYHRSRQLGSNLLASDQIDRFAKVVDAWEIVEAFK